MKLLIISTPFTGHISPTFKLAESLKNMGHSVDYITTPKWSSAIEKAGAGITPHEECSKLSVMIKEAYKTALSVGSAYDGIIYDELFFLGKALGDMLKVPVVRYFPCAAINKEIMGQLLCGHGFMGIFRLRFVRRRWTDEICKEIAPSIKDWTEEVVNNAPEHNIVFVPEWFQPYIADFPFDRYHFVGPSVYDDGETEIPECIKNNEQPVIYVSLGTIDNSQLRFYRKCLKAFAGKNARFIISVGKRIDIVKLGKVPDNCSVYSYAPQKRILEYSDLFVTHGGMNSINEAMVNGVPMMVIPLSNDQPINAKRVEELGLGKRFKVNKLNVDQLWESITEILSDLQIKSSVRSAKERLNEKCGGEAAAKLLTSLLAQKDTLRNLSDK